MINKFLTSNSAGMRLARTIVQGVIGVCVSYIDVLVGHTTLSPEMRPMMVALVMAVLSPIMAALGTKEDEEIQE